MGNPEMMEVTVAGHQLRLQVSDEERPHIESAAKKVTEMIGRIQNSAGVSSPAKIAAMAVFQCAFELSVADGMLAKAEELHDELKRQKEAVARLESLLTRVDDALAY